MVSKNDILNNLFLNEKYFKLFFDPKLRLKRVSDIYKLSEFYKKYKLFDQNKNYDINKKNVFFGHYWLIGNPTPHKINVCCLDYSVAKGGKLVAYRYNNELNLENSKIVFV
jgi:hypothetical protein